MSDTMISILIPSMFKRAGMLASLLRHLYIQIEECKAENLVEVLTNVDYGEAHGGKTTGEKRNMLLDQSKGKYVIFADDDDKIAPFYVEELLKASESDADCFAMSGYISTNGRDQKIWHISKDLNYGAKFDHEGKEYYERWPNHITCTKREIAVQIKFPHQTVGEDFAYSSALHHSGLIKTEYRIERFPMYYYEFVNTK